MKSKNMPLANMDEKWDGKYIYIEVGISDRTFLFPILSPCYTLRDFLYRRPIQPTVKFNNHTKIDRAS